MHELCIARSIVGIVGEQAKGRKVMRVTLEIGKLSAIMPEAIRFCFDVVARAARSTARRLTSSKFPAARAASTAAPRSPSTILRDVALADRASCNGSPGKNSTSRAWNWRRNHVRNLRLRRRR